MDFVFFLYKLLKNEYSRVSIKNIVLKVQLNIIQLTRSQSISQLSTKCTEVFFLFYLHFEIKHAIECKLRFKLKTS